MSKMRVLDSPIGKVVPVVDIAEMIGYHRSSITKAIQSNDEAFMGLKTFQTLPTTGGDQPFLCLNETGVDRLFLVISPSSKTKKDLFKRVEEFRLRAFGNLVEHKTLTSGNGNGYDITTEITKAKMLASATGGNVNDFLKIALKKCGMEDYAQALDSPAMVHGDIGMWMNPTDIGRECGLSPREVNGWLYNHDFQWPQNGIWRLTVKGEIYGEEYTFQTTSRHREIRIRWHRSILVASRLKPAPNTDQTALTVRA